LRLPGSSVGYRRAVFGVIQKGANRYLVWSIVCKFVEHFYSHFSSFLGLYNQLVIFLGEMSIGPFRRQLSCPLPQVKTGR
jgi:hypothetical protein